jgi:glycosyltransferase involved in cell wall biosynthesis
MWMETPTISCIAPVYNGKRFLAEALESILGQSYQRLEVVVVDDGSTDWSAEVARNFGGRIRYHRQANAKGRRHGMRAFGFPRGNWWRF